jgi:hypothetical protein
MYNQMVKRFALFAVITASWALPASAQTTPVASRALDTLILSPSQRRNLEAVRSLPVNADGTSVGTSQYTEQVLDATSKQPDKLAISGTVTRSGNRSTVWVNGKPLYARGGESTLRELAGQAGVVQQLRGNMSIKSKPGQTVDVPTGQAVDLLPPGAIVINRPKAATGSPSEKEKNDTNQPIEQHTCKIKNCK